MQKQFEKSKTLRIANNDLVIFKNIFNIYL